LICCRQLLPLRCPVWMHIMWPFWCCC
jgi:hypothetical protein